MMIHQRSQDPLDNNNHPELDTSEFLREIWQQNTSPLWANFWLVTLGRFDLHVHVAAMSRFRAAPRQGHMDRLKRTNAYAIRTKDYAVKFRTDL